MLSSVARWEDQNHFMQMGVVDFVPKYGLLPPLGFTVLRVMVHANCNPLVINNSFELRLKEVPIAKVGPRSICLTLWLLNFKSPRLYFSRQTVQKEQWSTSKPNSANAASPNLG